MPDPADAPQVDQARFRQVLGHFPTGVTVITTDDAGSPAGLAVGSFFSLSLDPALVGFAVTKTSSTWPHIETSGRFCVNILAASQEDVCRQFASKEPDKFKGIGWRSSPLGSPLIQDSLAWIDCTVEAVHDGGDHHIVVGRVHDLEVADEGLPLVFFRGGYSNLV